MRIKIAIALLACVLCCGMAEAKEWYEGGTLQKATVKKFIAASPENQLATVAEWIVGAMSAKDLKSLSEEDLKQASLEVVQCVKVAPAVYPDAPSKGAHL